VPKTTRNLIVLSQRHVNRSASVMYMADVMRFLLWPIQLNRKMCPERSIVMSLICISRETSKNWSGPRCCEFLVLAQGAKRPVPISAAISAKRATQASAKSTHPGGREQKGSWLRRLLVTAPCGMAPRLAPCHLPFCLYARPIPFFKSLLKLPLPVRLASDHAPSAQALDFLSCRARVP